MRREDLILVDKIHEDHWEEGLYLHNRPWHKWYWIPEQTSDEIILFVTWDSEEGETVGMYNMPWTSDFLKNIPDVSACPPHVSFMNPKAAPGFPARKSVEVRLMVFTRVDLTSVEKESVGTK